MKKGLFLITTAMLLASCSFFVDQAKDTVKKVSEISEEAANKAATKAGEIVGGSARSFGDGVGEGIDKSGSVGAIPTLHGTCATLYQRRIQR